MDKATFLAEYGDKTVKFASYYKYSFTFKNADGLSVSVGGVSDDIYRFTVGANNEYTVKALDDDMGINYASFSGRELGAWFDW